jgi:pimeloyl-ACP methyl ester carboxylesterase
VVIELIELLANVDWQDPGARRSRLGSSRVACSMASTPSTRPEAVRSPCRSAGPPTSSATGSTIPSPSTGSRAGAQAVEIQVPALIIHGTEDAAFSPARAVALADEIPDAQLVMIEQLDYVTASASFPIILPAVLSHVSA